MAIESSGFHFAVVMGHLLEAYVCVVKMFPPHVAGASCCGVICCSSSASSRISIHTEKKKCNFYKPAIQSQKSDPWLANENLHMRGDVLYGNTSQ